MEERRRHKRLDLNVSVQLERLDDGGITTLKFVKVNVTDLSKSGIGFSCPIKLEPGTFYDMRLQIWTKEIINAVIEIVRVAGEDEEDYHYGASFIGMTDTDALKIEIYQIFNELEEEIKD
ncbi:MAG: PilZ domain-containing protein [Lachnospiraceae bacterium]|nr:PilZ domain-containing protein [Lachnospiraceae bacterium]MBR0435573.1 PilZ domain-containing protein [Lachnospiraceae bacterium]